MSESSQPATLVVCTGGWSGGNLGDWAIVRADLVGLKNSRLPLRAVCHKWTPGGTDSIEEDVHYAFSFGKHHRLLRGLISLGDADRYDRRQRRELERFLQQLRERYHTDPVREPVLWIAGGGYLNDQVGHVQTTLRIVESAEKLGWTTISTGNTLGPFANEFYQQRMLACLSRCSWLQVRDRPSLEMLERSGAEFPQPPMLARDDAFYDHPPPRTVTEINERYGLSLGQRFAFLSIHAQPCTDVALDYEIARDAVRLLLTRDTEVLLVPMCGYKAEEVDNAVCFRESFGDAPVHVMPYSAKVEDLRALAARAALVVSTRFHALVFALAAGVPAIGAYRGDYYAAKSRDLLVDWQTSELALPYSGSSPPNFLQAIRQVLANEEAYRETLGRQCQALAQEQNPVWEWFRTYAGPASAESPQSGGTERRDC